MVIYEVSLYNDCTLVEYGKEGKLVVQRSLRMSISMRRGLHSKKDLGMESIHRGSFYRS